MLRAVSLFGGLVAAACVLVLALAVNGGLAYRIDCATSDGRVARHWSYEWNQPIPYLLAPSRSGCVTHSATRLLASRLGIAPVGTMNAGTIATSSARSPGDRYYAGLYAIGVDLGVAARSTTSGRYAAMLSTVERDAATLDSLHPPVYAAVDAGRFRQGYETLIDDLSAYEDGPSVSLQKDIASDIVVLGDAMTSIGQLVVAHEHHQ